MKPDDAKKEKPAGEGGVEGPVPPRPDARQLDILLFLALVGPADEGDVAYGLRLEPEDLARIPPGFRDVPAEFIARRELETLSEMGLVTGDGMVWELTDRARKLIQPLE